VAAAEEAAPALPWAVPVRVRVAPAVVAAEAVAQAEPLL